MKPDTQDLLELRVLYGPQAGSRMTLAPGEYLLGRSDQCAIMLAGSRMRDCHALLIIDDDGARLKPQDGAISDAHGKPIESELLLEPGVAAELGGTSIALDRPDAPWPEFGSSPFLPAVTSTANATAADSNGSAEEKAEPARKSVPWGMVAAGGAMAIAVIGIAGGAWMLPAAQSTAVGSAVMPVAQDLTAQKVSAGPPEALTTTLTSWNPDHRLTVQRSAAGAWLVRGYVPTAAQKKDLSSKLALLAVVPEQQVHAEDELRNSIEAALAARENAADALLKAEYEGEGRVLLTGAARRSGDVAAAKLALEVVPGVRQVETRVLLPEQLLASLKGQMESAGLTPRLSFTREWPEAVVSGNLNAAQKEEWDKIAASFTQSYRDLLPLRSNVLAIAEPSSNKATPLAVRVVVGGPAPYVVTTKGIRINRGGEAAGQRLVAVTDRDVVFEGAQRWQFGR